MSLGRLGISNIRNIKSATIELDPGINLFIGANGSGKTSLLEAVYFLGSGRTFRSSSVDPLISRGEAACTVHGVLFAPHGRKTSLGVQRNRDGQREIKINGEPGDRASLLARSLPTLVLGPNTVELLTGPPPNRRRFLNWGVFHVEPSFGDLWGQANRCLRQRNELLRKPGVNKRELAVWNSQLAELADALHHQRADYFTSLASRFAEVSARLSGLAGVTCRYHKGWEGEGGLGPVLARQADSDIQRGYTQSGHHRADLRLRLGTEGVATVCSRGELKILAWALVLSQGTVFMEKTGANLVYLVDDLSSELDAGHRAQVCEFLAAAGSQVLVTAIDREQFEKSWQTVRPRLFHVEHGGFSVEEAVNERR
jgi:DNA replication and repair protein RecF